MNHSGLFSFALTVALMASASTAKAYSFQVNQPCVKRFVKITSDNVNLRRLPNTNSGKLMTWNSDGGSFETYTKIFFSDTESSKYRANNMTGAYVDTYHPYNGNIYMVNSKKQEAQNCWYQIFVTAESYAESAEEPNSKMAWVKGDFCKVIDVNEDNNSVLGMMIPAAVYSDMETGNNVTAKGVRLSETLTRKQGEYANVRFCTYMLPDGENMQMTLFQKVKAFVYVSRCNIELNYGVRQNAACALKVVQEESDMEDADDMTVLRASLKAPKGRAAADALNNYLLSCTDAEFGKLMEMLCPDHKLPTYDVYFCGTDGKVYTFSYDSATVKDYGGVEYNVNVSK